MITIFIISIAASFYGTLIGGASLITIPALVLIGLPPHMAIGTDRFGIIGLGLAGLLEFRRKKMINYHIAFTLAIPAFFGAFLGANLALSIEENQLRIIIAIINLIGIVFILLQPKVGMTAGPAPTLNRYFLGAIMSFVVGIYAGFYGAMAGTFLAYISIFCFGQTFVNTAASVKIASVMSSSMATMVFAAHGQVNYHVGTAMFVGCAIGSFAGAHFSDRIGNAWIKRIFLLFLLIMVSKMIYSSFC